MSEVLYKARCTKGHIVIYDDKVTIELKGLGVDNSESVQRSQVVGVDFKTKVGSLFGLGGGGTLTVNTTGGKSLEAKMVKMKDAKKIGEILSV